MSTELAKAYSPQEIEQKIYEWWEREGYFKPEKQIELGLVMTDESRFCITMPPPNVTGSLHLGHAIVLSIEDLMTRYYRMLGRETLYLPGTDHAGIATQNVVERELRKQGIHRKDLGRDKFIEKVWEWKYIYHSRITEQTKRLGVSCDWTRERFTLDDDLSQAVRVAFVRLFKKGLIYRGTYLVNWCPRCESAISDLEAISQEIDGHLWYIRYPIITDSWKGPQGKWGSGKWAIGALEFIEVATTRPETILGDTAVATHPRHNRFRELIGCKAVLPALGRYIPIIADELIDPQFGTGAIKVTPAHDPNDYEIGIRHKLEAITIIDEIGRMNELNGIYSGLDRFECRRAIVADLEKEGLLTKIEPYRYAVNHCQRCHTIIEPRVSTQWFVKTKPLATRAIEVVKNGETIIVPEREEKRFFNWMENIRDWCISRQLWWGHRIPVWYCDDCGQQTCELEVPKSCAHCDSKKIHQDEDVLDTWFSSALWPFSTLGWPQKTHDFERYYPTDMRETAYDILFFWVAREMMMGIELTNRTPFKVVYLHGIVRNEHGQKISKSMENIQQYDPLNIIANFGADALRYTLVTSSTPGLDTNLDLRRIEGTARFCNKIWQATRFVLGNVTDTPLQFDKIASTNLQLSDRWILSRLNRLIQNVNFLFDNYQYGEAGRQIYDFFWDEFCDWYIEVCKVRFYGTDADKITPLAVLLHVLEASLRLLHPFMPYITEALWQALPNSVKRISPALIVAQWPKVNEGYIDDRIEGHFGLAKELIYGIRKVRTEYNVELNKRIAAQIVAGENASVLESLSKEMVFLAKLDPDKLIITKSLGVPEQVVTVVTNGAIAYLPMATLLDIAFERERLNKELTRVKEQITRIEARLGSEFSQKAPEHVVQSEQSKLTQLRSKLAELQNRLDGLM